MLKEHDLLAFESFQLWTVSCERSAVEAIILDSACVEFITCNYGQGLGRGRVGVTIEGLRVNT